MPWTHGLGSIKLWKLGFSENRMPLTNTKSRVVKKSCTTNLGWLKPQQNNGMFTTYQLVQDFATIHSKTNFLPLFHLVGCFDILHMDKLWNIPNSCTDPYVVTPALVGRTTHYIIMTPTWALPGCAINQSLSALALASWWRGESAKGDLGEVSIVS